MPYDPRMMQMAQMGMGMAGPQYGGMPSGAPTDDQMIQMAMQRRRASPFAMPQRSNAQPANPTTSAPEMQNLPYVSSGAPSGDMMKRMPYVSSGNPPPGLLQMLMLGGKPTYSGTPQGGSAPSAANPWAWLGSLGGGGAGGR